MPLAGNFGFTERIRGGHHIYTYPHIPEILNFQALPGGKAKPYQVKQFRQIVLQYGLRIPERK